MPAVKTSDFLVAGGLTACWSFIAGRKAVPAAYENQALPRENDHSLLALRGQQLVGSIEQALINPLDYLGNCYGQ